MVKCHGKEQPAEREGFVLVNDCRRVVTVWERKQLVARAGIGWITSSMESMKHEDQTGNGERLSTPNAHPQ